MEVEVKERRKGNGVKSLYRVKAEAEAGNINGIRNTHKEQVRKR